MGEDEQLRVLADERALREAAERSAATAIRMQLATAALAQAATVDQVVDAIVTHASAVLGATSCLVALLDEEGTELQLLGDAGPRITRVPEIEPTLLTDAVPITDALRRGEPVVVGIRNACKERDLGPAGPPTPVDGSLAALPLIVAGRAIGGIQFGFPAECLVDEGQWALARTIADLSAQALDRARLYDVAQRARIDAEGMATRMRDMIDALLAMAEALVQGDDRDDGIDEADAGRTAMVARRLVSLTRIVLGCRRVSITATDVQTGAARPVAAIGLSAEEEAAWRSGSPGSGLRDYLTASQRERLRTEDVLVLDVSEQEAGTLPFGVRTLLLAQMRVERVVVGVLSLDHGSVAHRFAPDEIALAQAVARLGALVIERERILREREAARAAESALQLANQRMNEFLGIAGHEIRTPLTTINGLIQIAQRRLARLLSGQAGPVGDAERLQDIQRVLDRTDVQLRRLNRLVADLLDVVRMQTGRLEMRMDRCDLAAIVRNAVVDQRQITPARTILLDLPDQGQVSVYADGDRVEQVVMNYLSNALRYTSGTDPVVVGLDLDRTTARVWVRDTGPGLAASERERIWERYYRVPGAEGREGSNAGLGLGLHICRTIIEAHGGEVGVESALGSGATFWFRLQLADPAA